MEVQLEKSWKNALIDEFDKPYFLSLINFVKMEYSMHPSSTFPKENEIFRALNLCPLDQVKVVIIGQDPYPTKGHAHGLCFSVEEQVKPFPRSLNNIFKEIEQDLGIPFPDNGSLIRWAKQGVLLLNATLTVSEGKPESHTGKGWETFTDAVIRALNERRKEVVFLLWGSNAQLKASIVDEGNNLVLKTVHPSPLSAYRGFFGSKHFSQTNAFLSAKGLEPINW